MKKVMKTLSEVMTNISNKFSYKLRLIISIIFIILTIVIASLGMVVLSGLLLVVYSLVISLAWVKKYFLE